MGRSPAAPNWKTASPASDTRLPLVSRYHVPLRNAPQLRYADAVPISHDRQVRSNSERGNRIAGVRDLIAIHVQIPARGTGAKYADGVGRTCGSDGDDEIFSNESPERSVVPHPNAVGGLRTESEYRGGRQDAVVDRKRRVVRAPFAGNECTGKRIAGDWIDPY